MSSRNIVSLDGGGIGAKVRVEYLNEKEKIRFKTLSAKDGVRFCVFDEDGTETFYQGARIKSNGLLATGVAGGTGVSKFLKEILKEGRVTIYQSIPENKYFIQTDKQEKVFCFEFGGLIKEEKKAEKLTEYLGCNFTKGTYDEASFNDLAQIKELINFYNTSCN